MKRLIILTVFLSIAGMFFFAQTNPDKEEIKSAVEEYIEGEYVRVPIEEFDTQVNNRISELLSHKLNTLVAFAIAIIGLLSALQIIQTRSQRDSIKSQIHAELTNNLNESFEKRLNKVVEQTENSYEYIKSSLQDEIERKVDILERKFDELIREKSEYEIERIDNEISTLYQKIVTENKYTAIDADKAERLLNEAESIKYTKRNLDIINMLSYVYYDQQKYSKLIELIDKYKGRVKLHYNTFINASLTAIRDYLSFSSNIQRDKAIEYLDNSLELRPGYGEALALKLEIYMMDYSKRIEKVDKDQALKNAGKTIFEILSSDSNAPASETINRLNRDNQIPAYKKYIDILFQQFSKEMEEMKKRAEEYNQKLGLN